MGRRRARSHPNILQRPARRPVQLEPEQLELEPERRQAAKKRPLLPGQQKLARQKPTRQLRARKQQPEAVDQSSFQIRGTHHRYAARRVDILNREWWLFLGRGGSKISDLQFESGCKINVTKEQDGDETVVVLTGDEKARQKAEELISGLTVDRERPSFTVVDPMTEPFGNAASSEPEIIDWQKLSEECVSRMKSVVQFIP